MNKGLVLGAALAALAFGSANMASAGVAGGNLGGVRTAPNAELVQTVHWKRNWHNHRWNKHRNQRHCTWRWGHKRCYWR